MFKQINGVTDVVSGYAGGHVADPSYEAVCREETGHDECVQLTYDPEEVSYEDLLAVHFTRYPDDERPGRHDVGTQYRSAVFYHDELSAKRRSPHRGDRRATTRDRHRSRAA